MNACDAVGAGDEPSPELWSLKCDATLREVIPAFNAAGVACVLLKGPVIAAWLYPEQPHLRTYRDIDLLIGPGGHSRADHVLRDLGFFSAALARPAVETWHAREYVRQDGMTVDLHRTLHELEDIPPADVWGVVAARSEVWTLAGVEVSVPSACIRALHLALSIGPLAQPGSRTMQEAEMAIAACPFVDWQKAAALARRWRVENEMGIRLARVDGGRALVTMLRLPTTPSTRYRLLETEAPTSAIALSHLASLRGPHARISFLCDILFPSRSFIREWAPIAERGRLGLLLAYAERIGYCAAVLPSGLRGWLGARRAVRRR